MTVRVRVYTAQLLAPTLPNIPSGGQQRSRSLPRTQRNHIAGAQARADRHVAAYAETLEVIHGLTDTVATTAPGKEEIRTSNRPRPKVIPCSEASNIEVWSQPFFRMPHRALSERIGADACRRSMRARHAARARPRAGAARRDGRARCKQISEQAHESAAPIRI